MEGEPSPRQSAPVCRRLQVQDGLEAEPREAMHNLVTTAGKRFQYRPIRCIASNKETYLICKPYQYKAVFHNVFAVKYGF